MKTKIISAIIVIGGLSALFMTASTLARPALTLPDNIQVAVLHLCEGVNQPPNSQCGDRGQPIRVSGEAILCAVPDTDDNRDMAYGCGRNGYPFNSNPITLDLEDYVKDVVPNELGAGHPIEAMRIEAVAARTVGAWKAQYVHQPYWPNSIVGTMVDNSTFFQLYISCTGREDTPCVNGADDLARRAAEDTAGIHLTYNGNLIAAEYLDTVGNPTEDMTSWQAYLKGISDPIINIPTIGYGMGHRGAVNWANGYNNSGTLFPQWNYQQVAHHYYSDTELRNSSNDILTPAYRWNPMVVTWQDTAAITPPTMYSNGTYNVTLHIQNSGTASWGSDVKLVYYWLRNGVRFTNSTEVDVDNLDVGDDDDNVTLSVQVPGSFNIGDTATLVIDMRYTDDSSGRYFHNREPGRPWFALTYPVCIDGECNSWLPLVLKKFPPCPHQQELILNGDFEDGRLQHWMEHSQAGYRLVISDDRSHSGAWYAYLAGYTYAVDIIYQDFVLPPAATAATAATLTYYIQLATINKSSPRHYLRVWLQTTDGRTVLLDELDNTLQPEVWHYRSIEANNLSSLAGGPLRLRFEAVTDDVLSSFLVDDVGLQINCNLNGSG